MLYSFLSVKLVSFSGKMKLQCSAVCVANMFWFFPPLSGMASGPQKKERLSTLWCIALATSKPGPLQVNKSALIHITLLLRVLVSEMWWWPLLSSGSRLQSSCISVSTEFKQFLGVLWQKAFFPLKFMFKYSPKETLHLLKSLTAGVVLYCVFWLMGFPADSWVFTMRTSLRVSASLSHSHCKRFLCSASLLYLSPQSALYSMLFTHSHSDEHIRSHSGFSISPRNTLACRLETGLVLPSVGEWTSDLLISRWAALPGWVTAIMIHTQEDVLYSSAGLGDKMLK